MALNLMSLAERVYLTLRHDVCSACHFNTIEAANPDRFPIFHYGYGPSVGSTVPANTSVPGLIVTSNPEVLSVGWGGYISEIFYRIVGLIAVNMVYTVVREFAVNVKPRKSVGSMKFSVNSENYVSGAGHTGRLSSERCVTNADKPTEFASLLVVMKKLAQACCGKIGLSHDVVPYKQLIGEKPRRVDSTSGLRHFSFLSIGCLA